jgi:hypothetical protein
MNVINPYNNKRTSTSPTPVAKKPKYEHVDDAIARRMICRVLKSDIKQMKKYECKQYNVSALQVEQEIMDHYELRPAFAAQNGHLNYDTVDAVMVTDQGTPSQVNRYIEIKRSFYPPKFVIDPRYRYFLSSHNQLSWLQRHHQPNAKVPTKAYYWIRSTIKKTSSKEYCLINSFLASNCEEVCLAGEQVAQLASDIRSARSV